MRHIKTDIAVFFLLFFVLPPFVWGADIRVQLEKNSASIEKEVDIAQAGLIKMQAGKCANPANLDASIRNLRRQLKELYSSLRRAEPSYGASLDEMKNITARLAA